MKKRRYKMKLMKTAVVLVVILLFIVGCKSKQEKIVQNIEVQFDIPQLLKTNIKQVKGNLGKPESEFIPNDAQLKLDPNWLSIIEYKKGTTSIQIDYSKDGKILKIFISDEVAGRTKEEIMKLGSLASDSKEYRVRIQPWLNPEYAKKTGGAEIAGIEVMPY